MEIVRGIYEAVGRRDTETPFEVYADDIVWDVFMDSVSYHGHEGVRQFWEEALSVAGTVDLDVEELIDAGDQVLALIREREVGPTRGTPVDASHVWVWTLADGKVVRMQIFDNREQALKVVGLAE